MNSTKKLYPFTSSQIIQISSKRLIILDLDDTLYSEKSWLFPAYDSIASFSGVPEAAHFMKEYFLRHGRSRIFQAVRQVFPAMKGTTHEWLEIMHNQDILLTPFHWVTRFLTEFSYIHQCIVTNGNTRQQLNKFRAIARCLPSPPPRLFCCNNWAPKPSPNISDYLLKAYNLKPDDCIVIGDSHIDLAFASNSNFHFIQVLNAG